LNSIKKTNRLGKALNESGGGELLGFIPYIYIREKKRIGRAFWQKQRRESEENCPSFS
jgi:hypothetical protein